MKKFLILLIKLYRKYISPLKGHVADFILLVHNMHWKHCKNMVL